MLQRLGKARSARGDPAPVADPAGPGGTEGAGVPAEMAALTGLGDGNGAAFTGPGHEQEDDITLVTLERSRGAVYAEGRS